MLASTEDADGAKVTRNVFTEIVYCLSGSRNISTALKTFGMQDETQNVIAVVPHPTDESLDKIRNQVEGVEIEFSNEKLQPLVDKKRVCATYSIDANELRTSSLVDSIVTRMACRDVR